MIATVFGRNARFCNDGCREGFRTDRRYGLIYPSYSVNGKVMSVEDASIDAEFCAYCNAEVGDNDEA